MKLDPFVRLLYLLPFVCHEVAANTEIINFLSSRERTVDLPSDVVGNWSKLHPSDNERRWTLEPAALHAPLHQVCEQHGRTPFSCPHERWVLLDMDDARWASFSTFTLRLSWPASAPADFMITLYSPRDLLLARLAERDLIATVPGRGQPSAAPHTSATPHAHTTRARYARIRAVDAGVPTPGLRYFLSLSTPRGAVPDSDGPARSTADGEGTGVPFIVVLEPLYLGVLPATLVPTVGFLIPVVLAAALSVPWVTAYFEPFVRQAREDLNTRMARTRKER